MLEAPVQQRVRLEAARLGIQMYRNNSGACYDATGRLIRYGLGNDSAEINAILKTGDLVGITPVLITPEMVGRVVGVFTNIECKASDWHITPGDARAHAQEAFNQIVRNLGGFAGFATGPDAVREITRR